MAYTISMVITGHDNPGIAVRGFWGAITDTLAAMLVSVGAGAVTALQCFTVIPTVPVSLILLPSLRRAPRVARELAHRQEIVKQ